MSWPVPARHPHVSVTILSGELLLALDADGARPIPGRLGPMILPLVDGCRSVLDIADALAGRATVADVAVGVTELVEAQVLLAHRPEPVDLTEGLVASGTDAGDARTTVSLEAVKGLAGGIVGVFAAAMRRAGVHVDPSAAATPRVVLVDDYAHEDLDAINRECLTAATPWLIVKPLGVAPWVGPMFDPERGTPCWQCLAARLSETLPVGEFLRRHYPGVRAPRHVPPAERAAIVRAAEVVAEWCVQQPDGETASFVRTIDMRTGSIQPHHVAARPGCPACGGGSGSPPAAGSVGHTDAETGVPARLARQVSPVTGVVARIACSAHGPAHIATADHVFPPEVERPDAIWRSFRRRTAACGGTDRDARVSAIAESVERYSGVYRESDRGRRTTCAALGKAAIHPNAVMGFSPAQFADRRAWNRCHPSKPAAVAEMFDEEAPLWWTAVSRLGREDVRWLPTALCYFGTRPDGERRACFSDSNGCAAGGTLDAAIVGGFLELVERDAVGIWWYNRLSRAGVDLATVPDPFVLALVDHHRRIDRRLVVLDITTDLGVPVFAALSSDPSGGGLTFGFGADFDPLSALKHALRELSLFLPELTAGRRRVLFGGPEPRGSYLEPSATRSWPALSGTGASQVSSPANLERVQAVASAHGLEVFVLDQTRPDVGVPVARVIVPGLRHFWPRFASGRLFSVPLRMGWRAEPTDERDLNPSFILV